VLQTEQRQQQQFQQRDNSQQHVQSRSYSKESGQESTSHWGSADEAGMGMASESVLEEALAEAEAAAAPVAWNHHEFCIR
jgi:hypothetical protein